MNLPFYQIDAFASRPFEGNPAAVCLLEHWPDDALMQAIAMENNLSETAFLVDLGDMWEIRWFTPTAEVDLCGHATLASAHALLAHRRISGDKVVFSTKKHGLLTVTRLAEGYSMDFPADNIRQAIAPQGLAQALGIEPLEVWEGREDYMVVVGSEEEVAGLAPDFRLLKQISARGVLVTAPGRQTDFVSRCFFPAVGVDEDPVTGSAHTTMTPYWSKRLGKDELTAKQLSKRSGILQCRLLGDRVMLTGGAVTVVEGFLRVEEMRR
jgi:PhzF family phenazine biosynthesis protein